MYFEVVAVKTLVVETGALGGATALRSMSGKPGSVRSGMLPAAPGGGHRRLRAIRGRWINFLRPRLGVGDREQIRMLNVRL